MKNHKWLIRPSQMGKLMKPGRSKSVAFGKVAMKCIKDNVLLHKYGVEPEHVLTKQMEKGILNEQQNIKLASKILGWKGVKADAEKRREANEFFIGEPDVWTKDLLADIKSSWSANTFPFFDNPENDDYKAQLQAYMSITGHKQAELVYVLSNHPDHIITNEIEYMTHFYSKRPQMFNANGLEELWTMAEMKATEIVNKQAYVDHIPESARVKRFIVERDDEYIAQMQERIIEARKIFDEKYNELPSK